MHASNLGNSGFAGGCLRPRARRVDASQCPSQLRSTGKASASDDAPSRLSTINIQVNHVVGKFKLVTWLWQREKWTRATGQRSDSISKVIRPATINYLYSREKWKGAKAKHIGDGLKYKQEWCGNCCLWNHTNNVTSVNRLSDTLLDEKIKVIACNAPQTGILSTIMFAQFDMKK